MNTIPEIWTTTGLLDHIKNVDRRMDDRAFAFILGASASQSSNILTSSQLVQHWLEELQRRLDPQHETQKLADWATAENLNIDDFNYQNAAAFYPQVFDRRFRDDIDEGYAYLEDVIEGKTPSSGYSILAQLLTETRHRVAVTTNLDNLISDALGLHYHTHPLVIAHSSLAQSVRRRFRRPLLVKIQQDLYLTSAEGDEDSQAAKAAWADALNGLFSHYTPIVIGYENDDTGVTRLLDQLENSEANSGIFWCYNGETTPNGRIEAVVSRLRGKFVPINTFDDFMQQLGQQFNISASSTVKKKTQPSLAAETPPPAEKTKQEPPVVEETAPVAITTETSNESKTETSPQLKIVASKQGPVENNQINSGAAQTQDDWKAWRIKIDDALNNEEKERLFQKSIEHCPNNAGLLGDFAYFTAQIQKNNEKAESLYRKAIKLDTKNETNLNRFANFMAYHRRSYDAAERLYHMALELNPNSITSNSAYAAYLIVINNLPKANDYAKHAWKLNKGESNQNSCEIAYYCALISMSHRSDMALAMGRLKTLLQTDYERQDWNATPVLMAVKYKLMPEDYKLVETLSGAILDKNKTALLEKFEKWRDIEAVPMNHVWDNEE